jgi:hypothetical protein
MAFGSQSISNGDAQGFGRGLKGSELLIGGRQGYITFAIVDDAGRSLAILVSVGLF